MCAYGRAWVHACVRACVLCVRACCVYVRTCACPPTCLPARSANRPTEAVGSWNVSANMRANSTRAWAYACVHAWVHASVRPSVRACVRVCCVYCNTCVRAHVRLPACRPDQQTDQLKQSGPGMCQRTCVQTVRVRGCMHAYMRGCMRPSVRACVRVCRVYCNTCVRAHVCLPACRPDAYLPAGRISKRTN